MTDQLNDLIAKLHAQAEVSINVDNARASINEAFNQGEEILALTKLHPDYSTRHGRIYPLFDEDEGERSPFHSDSRDGAIRELTEDIYYQWDTLQHANRLTFFTHAYNELVNSISSLATWHPDYNGDYGTIDGVVTDA